jgi:hypothetical protein
MVNPSGMVIKEAIRYLCIGMEQCGVGIVVKAVYCKSCRFSIRAFTWSDEAQ